MPKFFVLAVCVAAAAAASCPGDACEAVGTTSMLQKKVGGEPAGLLNISEADTTVYYTTTIIFGSGGPHGLGGQAIKDYVYGTICPRAASQMKECYRCPSPDGKTCVEYQAFANQAQFEAYTTYAWLDKDMQDAWDYSGSTTTGYGSPMTKDAFYAAAGGCEKVMPEAECPFRQCNQPSECPGSMVRYPGNNRCFASVWKYPRCNVDPTNDPVAHQRGDTQCNCAE